MKRCSACHCDKEESEFYRNRSKHDGLDTYCKTCKKSATKKWKSENRVAYNAIARKWRSKNPESYKASVRKWNLKNPEAYKANLRKCRLKKKYGISLERYNQMMLDQNGVCAICSQPESRQKQNLSVDHDHETGEIRALLCSRCNTGLGEFLDRAYLIDKTAIYLRRFKPVYEG